ncbi:MAG: hypothetical protein RLN99_01290 [Kiloniellaceae bacterium]
MLFAAQGLQGFLAAQGLAAWQGLAAAQGFAAQGLHGFLTAAAQGLAAQGFLAAQGLQGLQAAICTEVPAAWLAAIGSATAPAETVATLRATRVFFSMDFASIMFGLLGLPRKEKLLLDAAPPEAA